MISFFLVLQLVLILSSSDAFDHGRSRISVDYGPRLIGLAMADSLQFVKPMSTLSNCGDLMSISKQILDIAKSNGAIEILIGLPLDSDGKMHYKVRNFNARLCLDFSSVLCAVAEDYFPRVKVILVDERYTTREAKARMKAEKIKASLDAMSAACLLERYLEDEGEGAIQAQSCQKPIPDELKYFDYELVRSHIRSQYSEPLSNMEINKQKMHELKSGIGGRRKWINHVYSADDNFADSNEKGEKTKSRNDAEDASDSNNHEDIDFWANYDSIDGISIGGVGIGSEVTLPLLEPPTSESEVKDKQFTSENEILSSSSSSSLTSKFSISATQSETITKIEQSRLKHDVSNALSVQIMQEKDDAKFINAKSIPESEKNYEEKGKKDEVTKVIDEMDELELIRAQRRKKGTLKRLHNKI